MPISSRRRFVGGARRATGFRQETPAIAATSAANTSGFISRIWATTNSTTIVGREAVRRRPAALLQERRPAVLRVPDDERRKNRSRQRERQPTSAGERSQRRSDGVVKKARPTPAAKKAAVNFDRSMRPSMSPMANSQRASTGPPQLDERRRAPASRTGRAARPASRTPRPRSPAAPQSTSATASAAVSAERNRRQAIQAMSAGSAPIERERQRTDAELGIAEQGQSTRG